MDSEQILFDFAQNLTKSDKLNTATAKQLDRLLASYRNISEEEIRKFVENLEPDLRREYKKAYYNYINGGYSRYYPGVKPYRIQDLKASYRKEVQNSVDNSLALIKTQNQDFMRQMQDRFRNWATIPSNDLRGASGTPEKITAYLRNQVLQAPDMRKQMTAHQHFIVEDQTRKLISSMNEITAKNVGAIGFIWHNRRDMKVVGRPGGKYKPTDMHGDHWEREGQFYLVKDSWAIQRGLLKKVSGVQYDTDLKDGKPGIPIGCRCYAEWIVNIEDIPEKYRGVITEKGLDYIK